MKIKKPYSAQIKYKNYKTKIKKKNWRNLFINKIIKKNKPYTLISYKNKKLWLKNVVAVKHIFSKSKKYVKHAYLKIKVKEKKKHKKYYVYSKKMMNYKHKILY